MDSDPVGENEAESMGECHAAHMRSFPRGEIIEEFVKIADNRDLLKDFIRGKI